MIKISIITINYNNADGLHKTMQSVFNQSYKAFEYIVVDGASDDNSFEVIKTFTNISSEIVLKWISEHDNGIYNAMNKGIKMSSGDFLLFLNSGDVLYDNLVLEKCVACIDEQTDICSGILTLADGKKKNVLHPPKELSLYQSIYNHLTHPNTFIKRTLFEQYGLYNEDNKIVSDWEFFFITGGLNECKYQPLDIHISIFYQDGISSTNLIQQEEEKRRIMDTYLSPVIKKELEQRHALEAVLNQPWYILMKRLESHHLLHKLAVLLLKVLNKISRLT